MSYYYPLYEPHFSSLSIDPYYFLNYWSYSRIFTITFEDLKLETFNDREHVFSIFPYLRYLTQYRLFYFLPFTYIKFMI